MKKTLFIVLMIAFSSPLLYSRPVKVGETVYLWLDKVNVRKKAGMRGRKTGLLHEGSKMKVLAISSKRKRVTLRCIPMNARWIKVKTSRGKIGWVYEGAVRQKPVYPKKWGAIIAYNPSKPNEVSEDWGHYLGEVYEVAQKKKLWIKDFYGKPKNCIKIGPDSKYPWAGFKLKKHLVPEGEEMGSGYFFLKKGKRPKSFPYDPSISGKAARYFR